MTHAFRTEWWKSNAGFFFSYDFCELQMENWWKYRVFLNIYLQLLKRRTSIFNSNAAKRISIRRRSAYCSWKIAMCWMDCGSTSSLIRWYWELVMRSSWFAKRLRDCNWRFVIQNYFFRAHWRRSLYTNI